MSIMDQFLSGEGSPPERTTWLHGELGELSGFMYRSQVVSRKVSRGMEHYRLHCYCSHDGEQVLFFYSSFNSTVHKLISATCLAKLPEGQYGGTVSEATGFPHVLLSIAVKSIERLFDDDLLQNPGKLPYEAERLGFVIDSESLMDLYTNTPLGKAILEAFDALNEDVTDILSNGAPGDVKAYVFGGAALHILTNARGSSDIDVEIQAAEKIAVEEIVIAYTDENGDGQSVTIDTTFTLGISSMTHPDYQESAIPLMAKDTDVLHVYLVCPAHLAVSKLDRLAVDDQNDIISLAKAGRLTSEGLREAAQEALDYAPGALERLQGNIDFMVNKLKKQGY